MPSAEEVDTMHRPKTFADQSRERATREGEGEQLDRGIEIEGELERARERES